MVMLKQGTMRREAQDVNINNDSEPERKMVSVFENFICKPPLNLLLYTNIHTHTQAHTPFLDNVYKCFFLSDQIDTHRDRWYF